MPKTTQEILHKNYDYPWKELSENWYSEEELEEMFESPVVFYILMIWMYVSR